MSYSYVYTERLNGTTVEVPLADTRKQAFKQYRDILRLADTDPVRWKGAIRMAMASDLYLCGLFHSWWQRRDPWAGRAEVDCDFQFDHARWTQFELDDALNYSAREHGKSTWSQCRITQEVTRDPNVTIAIFSFDLQKGSRKHLVRWKTEVEENVILKAAWDDVFWRDHREEKAFWSVEQGCTVRRTLGATSPTISAYTFMKGLPTGSRFTILIFDDVETEETTESDELRVKCIERFKSALDLLGRGPRIWVLGTHHHPAGLINKLRKDGWKAKCFPAEDRDEPAPDIAAYYDAAGGKRPDTGAEIPEGVRSIRLRGAATYLHPLELAIKRFNKGDDAAYEAQYLGDPHSGQIMRFRPEWVADELRINANLREWAAGKYGYLLCDPSKGIGDPSVSLLLAADSNQTLTIVDGFRKKLSPSDWEKENYFLTTSWDNILAIRQIRVEVFGQATWDTNLRSYFDHMRYPGPPIFGVTPHLGNRSNQMIMRTWNRLEPLFKAGKLRLPHQLMVTDETGRLYDLIHYFLEFEYSLFPLPATDDILAALALVQEPADKIPPIEYPDRVVPWEPDEMETANVVPIFPGVDEESFLWSP